MNARQALSLLLLSLLAAASGWLLWLLRDPLPIQVLTGPPRSDYQLTDFSLVVLDEQGRESFAATGPRLARHPYAGTIEVSEPVLTLPERGVEGERVPGQWVARSRLAWVSADAEELRMLREVQVDAPPGARGPARLQSERLDLFPTARQVRSDVAVTASGPGFILDGVGLEADLDSQRFRLLDEVRARYAPPQG
ncbi:MAG: LPS export ABC transporter periplasmic protein LptC [Aquimonas sp.]|nr:LPS export ABC transporter periplasmic protein LptC [Aquimonas sp.]